MYDEPFHCTIDILSNWLIKDAGKLNMDLDACDFFDLNNFNKDDREKIAKGLVEIGTYMLTEYEEKPKRSE